MDPLAFFAIFWQQLRLHGATKVRMISKVMELEFSYTSRTTLSARCATHLTTASVERSWWQVKGMMESERFH